MLPEKEAIQYVIDVYNEFEVNRWGAHLTVLSGVAFNFCKFPNNYDVNKVWKKMESKYAACLEPYRGKDLSQYVDTPSLSHLLISRDQLDDLRVLLDGEHTPEQAGLIADFTIQMSGNMVEVRSTKQRLEKVLAYIESKSG
ncbi:hypothetical protein HQ529_02275 [Candidatus Woesearchaeota archaeon]|nr:hypothetical protein [Candidatus Woesearchaeota archaeon]